MRVVKYLTLCSAFVWSLPAYGAIGGTVSGAYLDLPHGITVCLSVSGVTDWVKWGGANQGGGVLEHDPQERCHADHRQRPDGTRYTAGEHERCTRGVPQR